MRVRGSARLERMPLAIDVVAFMIMISIFGWVCGRFVDVGRNLKSGAGHK